MPPKKTPVAAKEKKVAKKAASTGKAKRHNTRATKTQELGASFIANQDTAIATAIDSAIPVSSSPQRHPEGDSRFQQQMLAMMGDITSRLTRLEDSSVERSSSAPPKLSQMNVPTTSGRWQELQGSQGAQANVTPTEVNNPPSQRPDLSREELLPPLQALHTHAPTMTAADQQIAQWDSNTQANIQGKPPARKSGRYPANEIPTVDPSLRWPNQGLLVGQSSRRRGYDDLSLPQWVCGQLTNVRQVNDLQTVRAMISQMIESMKDACWMPWHQVREAYAHSMHEMEEGRLTWDDSVQWSLNRLNIDRGSNHNDQSINTERASGQGEKRPCLFYIEGHCEKEPEHGVYTHDIPNLQARRARLRNSNPSAQATRGRVQQGRYVSDRYNQK